MYYPEGGPRQKIFLEPPHTPVSQTHKVLFLLGVSSQALGGELETQICLGWRQFCLGFAWGRAFFLTNCSVHHNIISRFSNISAFRSQKRDSSDQISWGLLKVFLGCDRPMRGDVRFTMFSWGFDTFSSSVLGDVVFRVLFVPLLLGDLLGVDLLGSVRQGYLSKWLRIKRSSDIRWVQEEVINLTLFLGSFRPKGGQIWAWGFF